MRESRRHRRSNARFLTMAAFALLALLAPACGARWSDDQAAVVEARDSLTLAMLAGARGFSVGEETAGPAEPGATTTTVAGQTAGGGGGSGPAATTPAGGGGGAEGEVPAGAAACEASSDAPGVTDSTIKVGTITTMSGLVPGLGETAAAAVRAYAAYLNSSGGVCGRQVEVSVADDGMDNGRYRSIYQEQANKVFGIVGGVAGGDAGGTEIATQTGMPTVSNPISLGYYNVPNVFGVKPPYADPNMSIGKYQWLASQGVTKAAVVYTAVEQTRSEFLGFHKNQIEAAGIEIVLVKELPLATFNYDATASEIDGSGAQYMLMLGEVGMWSGMARSLERYDLEFPDYLPGYDPKFIEQAGSAAEGAMAWIRALPNEEAGSNPEHDKFLEWMGRAAPGIAPDSFAADSWAAAKAFFDTLQSLPGPITREGLLEGIRGLTAYDADGMIGEVNLGGKSSRGCFVGMRIQGGKYTRVTPESGFLCG